MTSAPRACALLLLLLWGCNPEPSPSQRPAPDVAPAADTQVTTAKDSGPTADGGLTSDGGRVGDGGHVGDGGPVEIVPGEVEIVMEAVQIERAPAAKPKRRPHRAKRRRPAPKKAARRAGGSVMKTIRAHMGEVESCYSPVALKDPSVGGKIVMQWTLGASGRPTAARVKRDTLKDKSVGRCIARKSKRWSFPPPSGGVGVVSYTYRLKMQ